VFSDETRVGDMEDCEILLGRKNVLPPSSVSVCETLKKGSPLPTGVYQESSPGSTLFFWLGEEKEAGCFAPLDVSPFQKLYEHVRLDELYLTSGGALTFQLRPEEEMVGTFFGLGPPSQSTISSYSGRPRTAGVCASPVHHWQDRRQCRCYESP